MTTRRRGRSNWWRVGVAAMAVMLAGVVPARSQPTDRWEVAGGLRLLGSAQLGRVDAVQTGNGGAPLLLFRTESELEGSAGWQALVGRRVGNRLHAEATIAVHSIPLATLVTSDFEGASATRATESLTHIQVEGGMRWSPARWALTSRTQLFAAAGGGYLRQLHAGRTLVENGRTFYAGGGVLRSMWRGEGRMLGARLDGRLNWFAGGADGEGQTHLAPSLTVAANVAF